MKSLCGTAFRLAGVSLALTVALAGCRYDGTGTKMQWAPDMADNPTVKPQENYIDPPVGSVPMSGVIYPASAEEAEAQWVMPAEIVEQADGRFDIGEDGEGRFIAEGKKLYDTFCIPCHGADGKGKGSVGPSIVPPDISSEVYRKRADGFFFYRITFGTAVMPGYGHAITVPERWMIVKYLRTLQN